MAASIITNPPPIARSASLCTLSSGSETRRWENANTTSPASPAALSPSVCVEVQPALCACDRANTSAPRLAVATAAPRRSSCRQRGRVASAGTTCRAPAATISPMGRLMKKIARQSINWVSKPPSSTPTAAPAPPTAPQTPSARARSRPLNCAVMIDRAAGDRSAAPSPCPARAANNAAALPASAEPSDAIVNTPRPVRNTRRRPSRSAARPPSRSRLPKISE